MRRVAVLTVVLMFAAFTGTAGGVQPPVVRITIKQAAFEAPPKPIRVGDVVEWVNDDVVDHTATEKVGGKEKGWDVVVRVGRAGRVEMKKAGTVEYLCRFHPNMTGKIVVAAR